MRPGPQNKRMRGRNPGGGGGGGGGGGNSSHHNRKGPNPLSRVYESNGPDVKIRGTASHIAEKYVTLARDAQSSGDPVSAENYLQHAEHYFRLIAAAQAQLAPQQQAFSREEQQRDRDEEFEEDIYVNGARVPGFGPQPIVAPAQAQGNGSLQGGREAYQGRDPREMRAEQPVSSMNSPYPPNGQQGSNGHAFEAAPSEPRPDGGFETGSAADGDEREPSRRRRRGRRRGLGDAPFGDAPFGEQIGGGERLAGDGGASRQESDDSGSGEAPVPEKFD